MIIQPDSTITLYSGVDIGTDMQLAFSSAAKQSAYFASKVKKAYVNCTIVKEKIGAVRVAIKPVGQAGTGEITGHDLASCNYMSFINPSFDNKTIYCYIVDYKYLNNETAEIMYMIDYWQTWLFDVTFEPMYIDREHLSQADWAKIEANPYDPTVPQMITEEPLPTAKMLEKPFYDVAWFDENRFSKDGRALMSCLQPVTDIDNGVYDALLDGSWKYWNVMLVQAPTDWSKFGEYDALDENDKPWKTDDICFHSSSFYKATADTEGAFDSTAWSTITVVNYSEQLDGHNRDIPVDGEIASCPADQYALSYDGRLFHNKTSSAQSFDYRNYNAGGSTALECNKNFEEVSYAVYSNMANPNKVEGQFFAIMWFFRLSYIWAGEELYNDPFHKSGSSVALNGQGYTWTTKPHGCDVYRISSAVAWKRLANFYAKYNAVSQIIGLFGVPAAMFNMGTISTDGTELPYYTDIGEDDSFPVPTEYIQRPSSVRNKKLLTSPYSYIRMISPDGQVKEFAYEKFKPVSESAAVYPHFRITADLSGDAPKLYIIPYKYDTVDNLGSTVKNEMDEESHGSIGTPWSKAMGYNMNEAICVEGFPEISFNTDGYLSFLGAEYASTRANDTTANRINMEIANRETKAGRATLMNLSNFIGNMFGSVAGSKTATGAEMSAIGSGISGGATFIDQSYASGLNRKSYEDMARKQQAAGLWGNGDLLSTDDPDLKRFAQAKAAYANDNYFGGTGGVIKYMRGMGLFDFVALNVQLRPEIREYYDKWFDLYGYASGRCGIPYVIQFCRGGSDLPHWVGSGGVMEGTTYVKTIDCKVEHAMMPVANAIKAMFDTGVRFKKGDLS